MEILRRINKWRGNEGEMGWKKKKRREGKQKKKTMKKRKKVIRKREKERGKKQRNLQRFVKYRENEREFFEIFHKRNE